VISPLLLAAPALAGSLGTADVDLEGVYTPRRVAVLVGVNSYSDPDLPQLRFSAKDATDLADALSDPRIGNFDRVWVLTDPEDTTAEGIARALEIASADLQRDDTFLLYLSGHGTLTLDAREGTRLWFLPSDSTLSGAREEGVAVSQLEQFVSEVPARRRVLVMDTCHNGREKSSLDPATARLLEGLRGDPPAPRALREVSESEARLFAAQYYQPALEDPTLENGVYTHFLLEALRHPDRADLSGDGLVDVAEAHDWARDHTITYTGGLQVPRAEYRIVGREEIYLSGNASDRTGAERALLAATDAILAGATVLVDGVPRGALPEVVPLDPGRHRLEFQDSQGRTLLKHELRVDAGETVMADDLFRKTGRGVEVAIGGVTRGGQGAGDLHDYAPELELAWLNPVRGPWWLATDLHARSSAWRGAGLDGDHPDALSTSGVIAAGGFVGWQPREYVNLGLTAELADPWRWVADLEGDGHLQGTLSPVPGARAAVRIPIGGLHLGVRYSYRFMPYRFDNDWTTTYENSVSLGVGYRR
jgi:hypothetical protein